MSTAFTWNWRVTAQRESLTDDEVYYVDLATNIGKDVANELAAALKARGMQNVRVILVETIP